MIDFVKVFLEVAKENRDDYIKKWLKGEVKDYDMDMMLIEEKKYRSHHYKKVFNEEL